jgi:hypothetical protein
MYSRESDARPGRNPVEKGVERGTTFSQGGVVDRAVVESVDKSPAFSRALHRGIEGAEGQTAEGAEGAGPGRVHGSTPSTTATGYYINEEQYLYRVERSKRNPNFLEPG